MLVATLRLLRPHWHALRRVGLVWLIGALALFLLLTGTPAQASNHAGMILHSAYWEDTTGNASLKQAQAQTYTPYQGVFSRGYSDSVHWIRLTIAGSAAPIGLHISPPWLNEITLYDPALPGARLTAGDLHPEKVTATQELGYSFELPASPNQRDIWIKLRSTSIHRMLVDAVPVDQLQSDIKRAIAWSTLYAGVLVLMLLALLSTWLVHRDNVLGAYLVRHTVYTYYSVGYLGLPALLLPPAILPVGLLDMTFSLSVLLVLPLGLWFDILLLTTYKPNPYLLNSLKILTWASVGLTVLFLAGNMRLALELNLFAIMVATLLIFATAWSAQPDPSVEWFMPKRVMLGYYALISGSLFVGVFGMMGWSQGWSQYLLILHGLVSAVVMTVILLVRGQRQVQHSQQMVWQLEKTQQDMQLEIRRRHEQSQFLHMLMHELKTPLSIIALALGTRSNREENLQRASRAVQDMKAVIDRCVQADQMGELSLPVRSEAVDLPALVRQLSNSTPMLEHRLELHAPAALPKLNTDQQLVQIVLNNLLDNAARYSDPVTPVAVTIHPASRENSAGLVVQVSNTPGLAGWPDEQAVFDKYYRSSGAQSLSGSGLGLYLARQLVMSLGGSLDYRPSSQHVEFEFWIPINPA